MAEYNLLEGNPTSLAVGDVLYVNGNGTTTTKAGITLPKGQYKLEVWGAGVSKSYVSSQTLGGYSTGELTLAEPTLVYCVAGGMGAYGAITSGSQRTLSGGFNGGGSTLLQGTGSNAGIGGCGASDIRIGTDSVFARAIVAGGSSGRNCRSNYASAGYGYGGGTTGGDSGFSSANAGGGTQSAGGTAMVTSGNGSFGQGGNGYGSYTSYFYGGGGGGWYGGASLYTLSSGSTAGTGGGGSGYVLTASSYKPSGYLLGEEYYLANAQTIAGNQSFPAIGGGTETGHAGNGSVRITIMALAGSPLYVKTEDGWQEYHDIQLRTDSGWQILETQ